MEVVDGEGTHHPAPTAFWVFQKSFPTHKFQTAGEWTPIRLFKVVRTAFAWIVHNIQGLDVGQFGQLQLAVGENLVLRNYPGVRIDIVLLAGAQTKVVDAVPAHFGTVVTISYIVAEQGFGTSRRVARVLIRRCTRQIPIDDGLAQIEGVVGTLKVIHVHYPTFVFAVLVNGFGVTRADGRQFARKANARGCFGRHARNGIDQFGQPRGFSFEIDVKAIYVVVDGVFANVYFLGKRAFPQLHNGGTNVEVFIKFIIGPQAHHAPVLKTEQGIVL